MRYQSWSEVPRNEPEDHRLAVEYLQKWYNYFPDIYTKKEWKIVFAKSFIEKHQLQYKFHNYDLAVFQLGTEDYRLKSIIEVNQTLDDKVTLPDGRKLKISKSRHSKAKQTMNDQISEDYIREYYPHTRYIIIEKSDCFNKEYLDNNLC